ncbi:hypothetical protein EJB05_30064, partial [Eragrostis curvula]
MLSWLRRFPHDIHSKKQGSNSNRRASSSTSWRNKSNSFTARIIRCASTVVDVAGRQQQPDDDEDDEDDDERGRLPSLHELVDPRLVMAMQSPATAELNQAVGVAAMCLQEHHALRPVMADVVTTLSFLTNVDDSSAASKSSSCILTTTKSSSCVLPTTTKNQ